MKIRFIAMSWGMALLVVLAAASAQPPETASAPPSPPSAVTPEAAPPPVPPENPPDGPPGERGKRWRGEKTLDADTRALLEEVMIARMSQELALDDEQTVLMVRRFSQFRDQMRELRKQRAVLAKEMQALTRQDQGGNEMDGKLKTLIDIDEKIFQARLDAFHAVSADLTGWQRAKLYLFIAEFENEVRGLMQKARDQKRMRNGLGPDAGAQGEKGTSGFRSQGRGGRGQGGPNEQP